MNFFIFHLCMAFNNNKKSCSLAFRLKLKKKIIYTVNLGCEKNAQEMPEKIWYYKAMSPLKTFSI